MRLKEKNNKKVLLNENKHKHKKTGDELKFIWVSRRAFKIWKKFLIDFHQEAEIIC